MEYDVMDLQYQNLLNSAPVRALETKSHMKVLLRKTRMKLLRWEMKPRKISKSDLAYALMEDKTPCSQYNYSKLHVF